MCEYLVKEDDHEIVADAEIGLVEFVWHVEPEALEFSSLQENGVEPRQREQQLAITERLATSVELLLRIFDGTFGVTAKASCSTDRLNYCYERTKRCGMIAPADCSIDHMKLFLRGATRVFGVGTVVNVKLWKHRKWENAGRFGGDCAASYRKQDFKMQNRCMQYTFDGRSRKTCYTLQTVFLKWTNVCDFAVPQLNIPVLGFLIEYKKKREFTTVIPVIADAAKL